jgi:hypothetical protein
VLAEHGATSDEIEGWAGAGAIRKETS